MIDEQGQLISSPNAAKPKGRRKDEIWDALITEVGLDPADLTKPERGKLNAAVKQLRDVAATPEQIRVRSVKFRSVWPRATMTAMGLVGNWAQLKGTGAKPRAEAGPPRVQMPPKVLTAPAEEPVRLGEVAYGGLGACRNALGGNRVGD